MFSSVKTSQPVDDDTLGNDTGSPVSTNVAPPVTPPAFSLTRRLSHHDIEDTNILESKKNEITDFISRKFETNNLDAKNRAKNKELIKRSVSHVMEEDIEVIAWVNPPTLAPAKTNESEQQESKAVDKNFVILHYKFPLYSSVYASLNLAYQYGYKTGEFFHKHDVSDNPLKKPMKAVDGSQPELPVGKTVYDYTKQVIIPICIGFNGALTGDKLDKTLAFYDNFKVNEVVIYFGEYNKLADPVNMLTAIGETKRKAWEVKNKDILAKYKNIKILRREDFIKEEAYKDSKAFLAAKFSNGELVTGPVVEDAQGYIQDKIDKSGTKQACQTSQTNANSEEKGEANGLYLTTLKLLLDGVETNQRVKVAADFYTQVVGTNGTSSSSSTSSYYSSGNTLFSAISTSNRRSSQDSVVSGITRMTPNGTRDEG